MEVTKFEYDDAAERTASLIWSTETTECENDADLDTLKRKVEQEGPIQVEAEEPLEPPIEYPKPKYYHGWTEREQSDWRKRVRTSMEVRVRNARSILETQRLEVAKCRYANVD